MNDKYIESRKKYNIRREKRIQKVLNGKIPKHIIIAGVPRSGKTTACSILASSSKYQHICMDAIVGSFEKVFPQLGITTYTENPDTMVQDMSKKVVPFLNSLVTANNYDKLNYKLIIDVLELVPSDFYYHIDKNFADIYFFATPDLTPEENFERIRKFDTDEDYTYYISDEDLMERCIRFSNISKYLQKECEKYNLPLINTSYNREEVIDNFIKSIST